MYSLSLPLPFIPSENRFAELAPSSISMAELQYYTTRIPVPRFDGSDPHGWVFRINEFFKLHGTPQPLRLKIISFYMDGAAATWFQAMKSNNLFSTWPEFLEALNLRFDTSIFDDHQGALSKLTQTGSVAEFQSSFEKLMKRVSGISESLLVSFFVSGLKPEIKREMSLPRPKPDTLMEAFALARAYEARFEEMKLESEPPLLPIRRLTAAELEEKRENGICYNCDKKLYGNHKCRSRFLFLLGDDEEGNDYEEEVAVEVDF